MARRWEVLPVVVAVAVALAQAGCGGDEEAPAAVGVVQGWISAVQDGDGAAACDLMVLTANGEVVQEPESGCIPLMSGAAAGQPIAAGATAREPGEECAEEPDQQSAYVLVELHGGFTHCVEVVDSEAGLQLNASDAITLVSLDTTSP